MDTEILIKRLNVIRNEVQVVQGFVKAAIMGAELGGEDLVESDVNAADRHARRLAGWLEALAADLDPIDLEEMLRDK